MATVSMASNSLERRLRRGLSPSAGLASSAAAPSFLASSFLSALSPSFASSFLSLSAPGFSSSLSAGHGSFTSLRSGTRYICSVSSYTQVESSALYLGSKRRSLANTR